MEIINSELILKDLEAVERGLKKAEADSKTGSKEAVRNFEILQKIQKILNHGSLITPFALEPIVQEMQLLAAKKQLYLLNGKIEDASHELRHKIQELGADFVIADLSMAGDLPELITAAYRVLDLISFFTTGEDETRAWTIEKGAKAPEAARAIHSDFEKKFIRAEVIHWQKLMQAGGWNYAKTKGLIRTEGKNYVVQDGDVLLIRHG